MIQIGDVHHPNDITFKYLYTVMPEKLKNYFKLPGEFVRNFPTNIIIGDGMEREMDWLILVRSDDDVLDELLINIEFQSSYVTLEKIKTMADYADYSRIYYNRPVLTVVVVTEGYENSVKEYCRTSSDILKPTFIHMGEDEITERLNTLEKKISNQEHLTDDEALDIPLLPMFSSRNNAISITERITRLFSRDKSLKGAFRNNIAFALSIMIRKYFDCTPKGKELLKLIEPEINKSKLRDVIDFEVDYIRKSLEHELSEKEAVIAKNEEVIAKNEEVIANNEAVIADKDAIIADNAEVIAAKDKEIRLLKAKLAENGFS